jgi:hypothetical protein
MKRRGFFKTLGLAGAGLALNPAKLFTPPVVPAPSLDLAAAKLAVDLSEAVAFARDAAEIAERFKEAASAFDKLKGYTRLGESAIEDFAFSASSLTHEYNQTTTEMMLAGQFAGYSPSEFFELPGEQQTCVRAAYRAQKQIVKVITNDH